MQTLVFHKWDTTREWIQSVAANQDGSGEFTTFGSKMKSWNSMTRDCLYYFENYLAALDAPGEWFLGRDGWLYYYPRSGEDLNKADTVAPRIERFIAVEGTSTGNPQQWVRHLHFIGLEFSACGISNSARGASTASSGDER